MHRTLCDAIQVPFVANARMGNRPLNRSIKRPLASESCLSPDQGPRQGQSMGMALVGFWGLWSLLLPTSYHLQPNPLITKARSMLFVIGTKNPASKRAWKAGSRSPIGIRNTVAGVAGTMLCRAVRWPPVARAMPGGQTVRFQAHHRRRPRIPGLMFSLRTLKSMFEALIILIRQRSTTCSRLLRILA
jgi:hypothetical protein